MQTVHRTCIEPIYRLITSWIFHEYLNRYSYLLKTLWMLYEYSLPNIMNNVMNTLKLIINNKQKINGSQVIINFGNSLIWF